MNITFTKTWPKANHLTHAGKFHADEVFATVILARVHPDMVLSRVKEIPADLPGDVFVYDIGYGAFDHHQQGGNGSRPDNSGSFEIKYSSCGLVWKEFGHEIVANYLAAHPKAAGASDIYQISEETISGIVNQIDQDFIQYIDADDNGQELLTAAPNYRPVFLADIINIFNPTWNETADADEQFMQAVELADKIFSRVLDYEISLFAAKNIVEDAIENAENGILVLEKYLTYEPALLSSKNPKAKDILFVVYPSNRSGYGVRAVPKTLGSFINRKDLPAAWAGLSGEDLQRETGVPTAEFCHNARFLAVADTFEDALALAKLAVNE